MSKARKVSFILLKSRIDFSNKKQTDRLMPRKSDKDRGFDIVYDSDDRLFVVSEPKNDKIEDIQIPIEAVNYWSYAADKEPKPAKGK